LDSKTPHQQLLAPHRWRRCGFTNWAGFRQPAISVFEGCVGWEERAAYRRSLKGHISKKAELAAGELGMLAINHVNPAFGPAPKYSDTARTVQNAAKRPTFGIWGGMLGGFTNRWESL
jgi:hypothetical protein